MVSVKNFDEMLDSLRGSEPYLEDGGFSARVIARLPEAVQLPSWLASLIVLGFTALGTALAAWQIPVTKLLSLGITSIQSVLVAGPLPVLGVAAVATLALSYTVVWLAQNDAI